jgi:hypothetical protein
MNQIIRFNDSSTVLTLSSDQTDDTLSLSVYGHGEITASIAWYAAKNDLTPNQVNTHLLLSAA